MNEGRSADRFPLIVVLLVLFLMSWIGTAPQVYASWKGPSAVPGWMKSLQLFILAPAFVALAAAAVNGGRPAVKALLSRLVRWRSAPAIYAGALLGPPFVMSGAILLSNALGLSAVKLPAAPAVLSKVAPAFLVYFVLNTEELAWRGYVLPRFLARWSRLRATLVLGTIWAVFHAPYFFMKGGHPGGFGPFLFVAMVLALALIFTRLFVVTGGSVLLTHLLHQSVNGWSEALPVLPRFAGTPFPAAIAVSATVLFCVVMVAADRAFWLGRDAEPPADSGDARWLSARAEGSPPPSS